MNRRGSLLWKPETSFWLLPALVALLVQFVYLAEGRRDPTFYTPVIDAGRNHREALEIASGEPLPGSPYWQPPLYPYLLAGIYRLTGTSILAAKLFQSLMGALSCILLGLIGRRAYNPRVGLIAGLLLALSGPFIFYNLQLLTTGLSLLLNLLAILLALRAIDRPTWTHWLLCGVAFGLSALALPNLLLLAAGLIIWMLYTYGLKQRAWGPAFVRAAILVGATLVVIAPVTIRNFVVSGQFIPISHNGGYNLYLANNPGAAETIAARPGFQSDRLIALPRLDGVHGAAAAQRWYLRKTWGYIQTHPGSFITGLAGKAALFVNAREIPRNEDPYEYRDYSTLLRVLMWRLGSFGFPFGLVMPLAVLGLVVGGAATGARRLLLTFAILYSLSVILFFVSSRHRLPVAAVLSIFAAAGAQWLWACARERKKRQAGLALAAILVAAVLVNWPVPAPTDRINFRAETLASLGSDAAMAGRFDAAERLYKRSIEVAPNVSETHTRLGGVYEFSRRPEKAALEYRKAVELDKGAAEAYLHIGLLRGNQGDLAGATASFRKAVEAWPAYTEAHYALGDGLALQGVDGWAEEYRVAWRLEHGGRRQPPEPGRILLDRGRSRAALTYYRHQVKERPEDPVARLGLARALTKLAFEGGLSAWTHEIDEAAGICLSLVGADPGSAEARQTLANALFAAGRNQEAMGAFTEAIRLAPADAQLRIDLARFLAAMNNNDRAIEELRRAVEADPRIADAHQQLGTLLQRRGDAAEARKHLRRAATLRRTAGSSDSG